MGNKRHSAGIVGLRSLDGKIYFPRKSDGEKLDLDLCERLVMSVKRPPFGLRRAEGVSAWHYRRPLRNYASCR